MLDVVGWNPPADAIMEYSDIYNAWVWINKNGNPIITLDSFFYQIMEWEEL